MTKKQIDAAAAAFGRRPKAAIQAKEHDGKIDTAGVTFYFSPMAEDVLRERDENVKAGASKL